MRERKRTVAAASHDARRVPGCKRSRMRSVPRALVPGNGRSRGQESAAWAQQSGARGKRAYSSPGMHLRCSGDQGGCGNARIGTCGALEEENGSAPRTAGSSVAAKRSNAAMLRLEASGADAMQQIRC
jgi:hypothetical protein